MGGTAPAPQRVIDLKPRTYLHLDAPMNAALRTAYSISPAEVQRHSFLPFVGFERSERQIDFDTDNHWKIERKGRPIRYASHSDAAIYSYYSAELGEAYERAIARYGLHNSVLAYRSGVGSNINFSKDLIDEVRERKSCVVSCYDISKFFDSIPHQYLERSVLSVLSRRKLESDWLKVFNSVTRYAWVDVKQLRAKIPRSSAPNRLCSIEQFRLIARPLVQSNPTGYGIPQGSPLSGLLANVFMLTFDQFMLEMVTRQGGSYRRYSDDIAIVLPNADAMQSVEIAMNAMLLYRMLRLNPKKTTYSNFSTSNNRLSLSGDALQYLGFTFDGQATLIRSSSLKRFYAKMKAAIRITVRAAKHAGYPEDQIRRRSLVGRFTHWGDAKNFVQYAFRASRIMGAPEIRRQLRNHVPIFRKTFVKYQARYYHGVR